MNHAEPYVGPKPFTLEDQAVFFGRDAEENDLLALIQAHPIVVLYAQSGAGKTSLLEAKLVPDLFALNAEVFRGVRVGGDLPPGIDPKEVSNVFVFNAIMTLRENPGAADQLVTTTLPEAFGVTQKPPGPAEEPLRVVIFDQFEEIFTSHSDRWADRQGFFAQVAHALKSDPFLHVVFAIREEHFASLLPYANEVPGRLRSGLRLERLRRKAALEAVINPLAGTERRFAPDAANLLVANLMSNAEYVDPLHLQVVCRNLWQSLDSTTKVITAASIQTYGDLDAALRGYYEECVAKVVSTQKVTEAVLRNWFGTQLILPGNKRNLVYQDRETTAGLGNDVVKLLDQRHLIRPELRGGTLWYELSHDRFVRPIVESNTAWQQVNDATGVHLRQAAERWQAGNHSPLLLLEGAGLTEARAWRQGPGAEIWEAGGPVREFVEASESRENLRHERRRLFLVASLGVVVAGLIVVAGSLWFFLSKARRAEKIAEHLRAEAEQTKLVERGIFASSLVASAAPPRQIDALVWAIKAAGPALAKQKPAPDAARKGLQDSIGRLGTKIVFSTAPNAAPQFFSNDERTLLSSNGWLQVVDAKTGANIWARQLAENVEYFQTTISSDSSQILATASFKQTVTAAITSQEDPDSRHANRQCWLLEAATGKVLEAPALADAVGGFFDWNGSRLVILAQPPEMRDSEPGGVRREQKQYQVRILNAANREIVREIAFEALDYLAISSDGKTLATLLPRGIVQFWNVENKEPPRKFELQVPANASLMFSPDGKRMFVADTKSENQAIIVDVATGEQKLSKELLPPAFSFFTADSSFVVVPARYAIRWVDAATGETARVRDIGEANWIFFAEGQDRVVCIAPPRDKEATIDLLELSSGKFSPLPPRRGEKFAASRGLDRLVSVDEDGVGRIFGLDEVLPNLSGASDKELLRLACDQLGVRLRPGGLNDLEVTTICAEQGR